MSEPYVITRLCQDCVDGDCVEACPVECIVEEVDREHSQALPNQLFINPDDCIYCGACEPACPWQAIFTESEVPSAFEADIALNAITAAQPERFRVAEPEHVHDKPTSEAVEANRRRHLPVVSKLG